MHSRPVRREKSHKHDKGAGYIIVGLIIIAAGIVLGIYVYQQGRAFMLTAVETTATITDIKSAASSGSKKKTRMAATVTFKTENGSTQTARLDYYVFTMNVGDTVEIKYDPAKPSKIVTGGPLKNSMLAGGVIMLFGMLVCIAGIIGLKQKSGQKHLRSEGTPYNDE